MSILPQGPWENYTDLWVARLSWQLHNADQSPALQGWRESGVRDRIDRFSSSNGVVKLMKGIDTTQTSLVHGDFSKFKNMISISSSVANIYQSNEQHAVRQRNQTCDSLTGLRVCNTPFS